MDLYRKQLFVPVRSLCYLSRRSVVERPTLLEELAPLTDVDAFSQLAIDHRPLAIFNRTASQVVDDIVCRAAG